MAHMASGNGVAATPAHTIAQTLTHEAGAGVSRAVHALIADSGAETAGVRRVAARREQLHYLP